VKSALATDLYQLTMMAGYERAGVTGSSTFELFVRDMPPYRGFLVAAGLAEAVEYLTALRFTPEEIAYLRTVPGLAAAGEAFFNELLPSFRFEGDVWAMREGEPAFAGEPMLRVRAAPPQAQLVETALLAIVNFQTLIASKAARIVAAAAGRPVLEFGTRRAHGLDAALYAARAAFVAGCAGTSNVEAGYRFGIPLSGTMAHSWVQSFPTEIDAFRTYLDIYGPDTTLLVDTYDTLHAVRAIVSAGLTPGAVRLDSGDFGPLSRDVRAILDAGGLRGTKILASGDLDEDRIAALLAADAPIDAFGVGTTLSTSRDSPALGGVYKLVETERDGVRRPVMKLSPGKHTLAAVKQVWRMPAAGAVAGDIIGLADEVRQDGRPLLQQVMQRGQPLGTVPSLHDARVYCLRRVAELPDSVKRLGEWEDYAVTISEALGAMSRAVESRVGQRAEG
jgi:nicotinate phosphoribosyltransferase